MRVVEALGLAQLFGGAQALHPLDLELEAGERLAVLGENGAGKTTLLRLLATAARPAAGELRLFGRDALRERARLRARIGFLAHQPGLYPALTAAENLGFFADLYGLGREQVQRQLELAGLAGEGRLVGELSRGLQQRLALARSALHDPPLWVLDEPDASLDSAGEALLERLAEGRTLVIATHDRALARRLCGRVLTLRDGRAEAPGGRLRVVR
ncbi:MAG TPA: heme ABC exporter ATP-binding protein CcmA [Candidatus Acidoferrales bacterium]|nr:heme ABC exporter ATP-binding protein CcmA [Candidatus Acidoferrales bacterium]